MARSAWVAIAGICLALGQTSPDPSHKAGEEEKPIEEQRRLFENVLRDNPPGRAWEMMDSSGRQKTLDLVRTLDERIQYPVGPVPPKPPPPKPPPIVAPKPKPPSKRDFENGLKSLRENLQRREEAGPKATLDPATEDSLRALLSRIQEASRKDQ